MKKDFFLVLLLSVLILMIVASALPKGAGYKSEPQTFGCYTNNLSGKINLLEQIAFFEGKRFGVSEVALAEDRYSVLSVAHEERWIEVDLSEQKMRAWEGEKLFLESKVSTGLPWWPTPTGEFRVWIKLRATKMEGGSGRNYYYLPNVPYVMFFENEQIPGWRGYGLHGTYWHEDFGNPRSHGCINLPTSVARELYYWVNPTLVNTKWTVRASEQNPGTKVIIHE